MLEDAGIDQLTNIVILNPLPFFLYTLIVAWAYTSLDLDRKRVLSVVCCFILHDSLFRKIRLEIPGLDWLLRIGSL